MAEIHNSQDVHQDNIIHRKDSHSYEPTVVKNDQPEDTSINEILATDIVVDATRNETSLENTSNQPIPSIEINQDEKAHQTVPQKRGIDETGPDETGSAQSHQKLSETQVIEQPIRLEMATHKQPEVPVMPIDRRPTPGRIINPRAVNEEGAEPIPSRGNPDEWPARDKDYSNRSYFRITETGQMEEDEDAPKGPPKKKGRRNNPERAQWEKEQHMKDHNRTFHVLHLCFSRGKNGPPTYDKAGYQLDYDKVADWMKPKGRPSRRSTKKQERYFDDMKKATERMAEIFFEEGGAASANVYQHDSWKDRVSKDLGIPMHQIGVEQFEEWEKRGFAKAKKGEYENFSPEYQERLMDLMSGAALRVGSMRH